MKILIAEKDRAFCLHLPLTLMCSRVGAALLASGFRRMQRLPDGATQTTTARITTAQMHSLLKALRQSRQVLKQTGLPLLDVEEADGSRIMITL